MPGRHYVPGVSRRRIPSRPRSFFYPFFSVVGGMNIRRQIDYIQSTLPSRLESSPSSFTPFSLGLRCGFGGEVVCRGRHGLVSLLSVMLEAHFSLSVDTLRGRAWGGRVRFLFRLSELGTTVHFYIRLCTIHRRSIFYEKGV